MSISQMKEKGNIHLYLMDIICMSHGCGRLVSDGYATLVRLDLYVKHITSAPRGLGLSLGRI